MPADLVMSSNCLLDNAIVEENVENRNARAKSRSETSGSEKIQLLRRQMEENRQRMAERESSKRDIEEMVTQLKAKFDTTQHSLEKSAELGRSTSDLSILTTPSRPETPAYSAEAELCRKIRHLENEVEKYRETSNNQNCNHATEMQQLQNKILDLEENLREKESVIAARTQAVTLMSESLSQKTHSTVNLLEETKQEMFKMQEAFICKETQLNDEISIFKNQLESKDREITNLQEVNDILETTRFDLTVKNAELTAQGEKLINFEEKIDQLSNEKCQLQVEINQLRAVLPSDDSGKSFNEFLAQYRSNEEKRGQLEESLMQKSVECSVLQANLSVLQEKLKSTGPKPLFVSDRGEEGDQEASKLRGQLDEVNKSQIKMKLKIKQLQKQVDSFRKMSDLHKKVFQLLEENEQLKERIVKTENNPISESIDDNDTTKKIKTLEATCHNQVTAIQLLEEQKIDLVDQVCKIREELEVSRTAPVMDELNAGVCVSSQINNIELEETIEKCTAEKETLIREIESLIEKNENLREKMTKLDEEKQDLLLKLDQILYEKQELLEKIDKLSIKNVSSVESLEIVENLTQQEQLEMEQQETGLIGEELSDSLMKLREESSELMNKIEVFTNERREIHQQYVDKIEKLERQVKEAEIDKKSLEKRYFEIENVLTVNRKSLENVEIELEKLTKEFNHKTQENLSILEENSELKIKVFNLEEAMETLHVHTTADNDVSEKIALLKTELDHKDETITTINNQIMELYALLEQKNVQLLDREDEIIYLKDLHKTAVDQLNQTIATNDQMKRSVDQLRQELRDIEQKNARVANATDDVKIGLEKRIQELEDKVTDSEGKRREQLEKLKKFAANLKKKTQHCTDLEAEIITRREEVELVRNEMAKLQNEYIHNVKILSEISEERDNVRKSFETATLEAAKFNNLYRELQEEKTQQMQAVQEEINQKQEIIEHMQQSLTKSEDLIMLKSLVEEKDIQMQNLYQLAETAQTQVAKITQLKREENDKLNNKICDLEKDIIFKKNVIDEMKENFPNPDEILKLQNLLKKKDDQIQHITLNLTESHEKFNLLQEENENIKESLQKAYMKFHDDTHLLQESYQQREHVLQDQIGCLKAKITEHLMYIESKESENASLNMRILRLEEGISNIEARRNSLEKRNNILGDQLRESQAEFSENEDKLLQRLVTLSANDEIIAERLQETHAEKLELVEAITDLQDAKSILENHMDKMKQELEESRKKAELQENECNYLSQQLDSHNGEIRKLQEDLERKLKEKCQEIDELELESSSQLQKIEDEKKILQEILERIKDENSELQDEIMNLRENVNSLEQTRNDLERDYSWAKMENETLNHDQLETQDLRMQVVQDQTEIENLKQENQALRMSHESEVDSIQKILDKVKIEKENLEAEMTLFKIEKKTNPSLAVPKEEVDKQETITKFDMEPPNIPSFIGAKFFVENSTAIDFFDQPEAFLSSAISKTQDIDNEYENRTIVVEELIVPKTAYICHPKTNQDEEIAAHQDDEVWGWSAEEAALEEQHQQKMAPPPVFLSQSSQIEVKFQIYEDKIKDLEAERESLKDEISKSKQKSEKMLKKLKEYRIKCEDIGRSNQSSFDLDLAIQEELKEQVKILEEKLASERKQLTCEVDNLNKKIEVISVSNEKFLDLKEQQDAQVEMYRNQIKALNHRLQEMEKCQNDAWNQIDEVDDESKESVTKEVISLQEELFRRDAKISELNDKISNMEDDAEQFVSQIDMFRMESASIKNQLEQLTVQHEKLNVEEAEQEIDSVKFRELQNMVQELQEERSLLTTELKAIREQANLAGKSEQKLEELTKELRHLQEEKVTRDIEREAINKQWQQTIQEREESISNNWKLHLAEREAEFCAREDILKQELGQQARDHQPDHVPPGIAEMVANMQNALESQELELVTLKDQLAIRSAEYAALSSKLDPFGHSATSNMALVQPKIFKTPSVGSGEIPPRSDLDLALYTLHQRDMRCEELTLELTRLLEERDTLQLKLSSAIRQIESMKYISSPNNSPVTCVDVPITSENQLSEKISELQSISHARDKNFHEERQQRHKQMSWFWSNT
ncbi:hypothetical protein DMENIID0001_126460 [Sergentomyia squamirostris]